MVLYFTQNLFYMQTFTKKNKVIKTIDHSKLSPENGHWHNGNKTNKHNTLTLLTQSALKVRNEKWKLLLIKDFFQILS
ncbi:hypothetical protein NQ318_009947 [Aromia moschata]|uniref:Uncharacterized protein n=1 Tax=Aromia moschata TaxID=1265417 RepID=A0AAV8XY82_9CUCU|nr:hypothetical protein NQ318_009947 [Aromia moschata]